jgi:uncharacterized protein involved in exopolysaccharide biosynthesis
VDESREGGLIQVVDAAAPPERKSKPKRLLTALGAILVSGIILIAAVLIRHLWPTTVANPAQSDETGRLPRALGRRRRLG